METAEFLTHEREAIADAAEAALARLHSRLGPRQVPRLVGPQRGRVRGSVRGMRPRLALEGRLKRVLRDAGPRRLRRMRRQKPKHCR